MHNQRGVSSLLRGVLVVALLSGATGCTGPNPPPGCENPQGCNPPSGTDAGQDAGGTDADQDAGGTDADQDAGEAGTPLILTQVTSYFHRGGIERVPRDFTANPAELLVDDGGTPVSVQGTLEEAGSIRFDVSPGTYLIKSSSTQYILTSSRTVDIGSRRIGRPERGGNPIEFLDYPHPARLELAGLEPVPGAPYTTSLQFGSMDLEEDGHFILSEPLQAGQTSVVDTAAGYLSSWNSIPRFDPARGDTAWVLQRMSHDAGMPADGGGAWMYETLVRAAHLEPFSFDGGTLTIKATLEPAPRQDLLLEWRRSEFDALRLASASTEESSANPHLEVYPTLKNAQEGWVDLSNIPLLTLRPPDNAEETTWAGTFSFGNPYPSGWEPVASVTNIYSFSIQKYDGSRTTRVSERLHQLEPLSNLSPLAPRLSLPRSFEVEGTPALMARRIGTTTPLVTWQPPGLGTANGYTLLIQSLQANGALETVARIHVTDARMHRVRLPPGLLTSGNDYILQLTAHSIPSDTPEWVPFMFIVPQASATTTSGILTVP